MAVLPTKIVEVEFDAGTWTDVTADHVSFGTRRGRNRELGTFETGHLALPMRNDGRKYDPDNTAGPYYGKLRPNRRVRIRATYNAVTYPVFLGYIDRISQVPGGPNDATAVFEVSDAFKLLNRTDLPPSVYAAEVATDTPSTWWRFGEPAGSTQVYNHTSAAVAAGTVIGTPVFGTSGLTVRDPDTAVTIGPAASTNGIRLDKAAAVSGTGAFSIEFLMRLNGISSSPNLYMQAVSDVRSYVRVFIDAANANKLTFAIVDNTGTITTAVSTLAPSTGVTYHVMVTKAAGAGAMKIYVDGVDVTSGSPTAPAGSIDAAYPYIGLGVPYAPMGNQFDGIMDELAIYPAALTSTRAAAHNSAARTPWNGDLPGTRLGRILDLGGVPTADRNLDAGTTTLQSTSLGGTLLAYAQKVEETEAGELFVARDGKVRFIGRQALVTGTYLTSQATLTDADAGAGLPYRATSGDVDEAIIITRATVSREGSTAIVYEDTAAETEFKYMDDTHQGLLHNSDDYSLAYAQWLVNTHKAPSSRVGAVTMELTGDPPNMYPGILALEIGDRVTYKRKPQNVGATLTMDMRVEAIGHETGAGYWTTQLQLTPINLAAGLPVFVWDVTKWDQHVWGF